MLEHFEEYNDIDGNSPLNFGITTLMLNSFMLTSDRHYVETWRGVIQTVNANSQQDPNGVEYPRMFGDQGRYAFQDEPFQDGAEEVLYWIQDETGVSGAARSGWQRFLAGAVRTGPRKCCGATTVILQYSCCQTKGKGKARSQNKIIYTHIIRAEQGTGKETEIRLPGTGMEL